MSLPHQHRAVMPALLDIGVPVPRVHVAATARDRPVLLLSWCDGGTLLRELGDRPWRVLQLGAAMGRVQAAIHSLPVTDAVARYLPA